jgi:hypothetical protein
MRHIVRTIAVMAVTAGLLVACNAAATPTPAATPAPTQAVAPATPAPPDPTGTPVPSPTVAPSVGPMDAAYVTGSATGGNLVSEGTAREEGALTLVEGVELDYIGINMSDARGSGVGTMHLSEVATTEGLVGFQSGTLRIQNADGAWEGAFRSACWGDPRGESDGASWMIGSGAYEGLTFYLHFRGHSLSPAELTGVILPAPPPVE